MGVGSNQESCRLVDDEIKNGEIVGRDILEPRSLDFFQSDQEAGGTLHAAITLQRAKVAVIAVEFVVKSGSMVAANGANFFSRAFPWCQGRECYAVRA